MQAFPPRTIGWQDLPPVVLLFAIAVGTGLWGIDFGTHWDERPAHVARVAYLIANATWLPDNYNYPSLNQWIGLAALAPDWLRGADLLETLSGDAYLIRYRTVLVVVCALSIAWVYGLLLRWRGRRLEAFVGAAALGLSWEVAYHARFVATDALLMQFGALTALGCGLAMAPGARRRWLVLAAVAAGLGCGSKYPGGALLLPVLAAGALREDVAGVAARARRAALLGAVFGATYLLTTPGTLLRFEQFTTWVGFMTRHYAEAEHFGFNVEPGWPHLVGIFEYLAAVVFSRSALASLGLSLLAGIGFVAAWRESWRVGLVLACFPVFYVLYFSAQGVLIVRNLLVVVPFLAIAVGLGFGFVRGRIQSAPLRRVFEAAVLGVLAGNAVWLVFAAETVADRRNHDRWVEAAVRYVVERPERRFALSPGVTAQLEQRGLDVPQNAVAGLEAADGVLFFSREPRDWLRWPANRRGSIETWFGPFEVNFERYPVWRGQQRIVVMSPDQLPDEFRSIFRGDPSARIPIRIPR